MELKIEDEFGIVTDNRKRREIFARFVSRRIENVLSQPAVQKRLGKAIDRCVEEEVARIIERRREKQMAEFQRVVMDLKHGPDVREILALVCDITKADLGGILGPRRSRNLAWPRFFAAWLMRQLRPDLSLPAIGRVLGGRDHTSIMHATKTFHRLREEYPFAEWLADPRVVAWLKPDEQKEAA